MLNIGSSMYELAVKLFPICRSITGNGFRESLKIIQDILPELKIYEVSSGTKCFDWTVPDEWNIEDAYIVTPDGQKICQFTENNLHVVGYSVPVDQETTLDVLQDHLYSLPANPNAIPYVTSYYEKHWGFCVTHEQRASLKKGKYRVVIDSELKPGVLNYGEIYLPGESKQEVFISTYMCHPSMGNNELSGPVVTTELVKWLKLLPKRKYSYRVVIVPETIGSITYLSRNYKELKANVVAGFNITCVGDNKSYSYLSSRKGDTLADKAGLHIMKHYPESFKRFSFLDRGSDERQYCAPGIDLPVCSLMRTRYGDFPEYHTSLDNLDFISPQGLLGGFEINMRAIEALELNDYLKVKVLCEPQLGKRGLYPTLSTKSSGDRVRTMMNLIAYCDGEHSLLDIAEKINHPIWGLYPIVDKLKEEGLLKIV